MQGLVKKLSAIASTLGILGALPVLAAAISGWGFNSAPTNVPNDLVTSLMNITNWVLGFVAIIAVLIIIWGGVQYLTAAGSEDAVAGAKKTISFGIIGLVITGIAYAIVMVVISIWLA